MGSPYATFQLRELCAQCRTFGAEDALGAMSRGDFNDIAYNKTIMIKHKLKPGKILLFLSYFSWFISKKLFRLNGRHFML